VRLKYIVEHTHICKSYKQVLHTLLAAMSHFGVLKFAINIKQSHLACLTRKLTNTIYLRKIAADRDSKLIFNLGGNEKFYLTIFGHLRQYFVDI